MSNKQKSIDYKNTAVEYFLVGDTTQEEVCRIFKCSRRSIMRWVEKYTTDGEITGYERKPIATKVHKEHIDFLLSFVYLTMLEIYFNFIEKNKPQLLDIL